MAQCLKYMALLQKPLGLLLNFNKRYIAREGLKRLVMSEHLPPIEAIPTA